MHLYCPTYTQFVESYGPLATMLLLLHNVALLGTRQEALFRIHTSLSLSTQNQNWLRNGILTYNTN